MKNLVIALLVLQTLVFNAWAAERANGPVSQNETYFDELYQENGELRPQYTPLKSYIKNQTPKDEKSFLEYSRRMFRGDNALDPEPRLILPAEKIEVQRGVEQRALAIREFLKDHYSGKKTYAAANVIPAEVVRRIIARSGDSPFEGHVDPQDINFFYGPDVIRDAEGTWRVIEDNPGFIGGIGDLMLAYKLTLEKHPQIEKNYELVNPKEFYHTIAETYRTKAAARGGKAIVYMLPPYADNEDSRIRKIFAAEGVETITPYTQAKLKITANGVFTEKVVDGLTLREKVGFVFLSGEHAWIDNTNPLSRARNVMEDAKMYLAEKQPRADIKKQMEETLAEVDPATLMPNIEKLQSLVDEVYLRDRKSYAAGLTQAILYHKVGSNYTPGIDFIGDKEFYVYVEELVRFYLHEEPILRNIPTQKFFNDKTGEVNAELLEIVARQKDTYVTKKVDGRGGDAVWVGSKTSMSEIKRVLQDVRANPEYYIAQKFTPLSVMGNNIVDLRALSWVSPEGILVGPFWGRGLPRDGNGKVNLSDQGREVTVLLIQSRILRCEDVLLPKVEGF